mgnify:CR=1 FL=1
MKAIILAGGPGTRLRPLTCTRPKLLMPIANRALLDWTFERLSWAGVSEVVLAVNYMAESLRRYFGRERYGIKVKYSLEPKAMGTGGPIKLSQKLIKLEEDETLLIMNGDIWCDLEFSVLEAAHKRNVGRGAVTTITLYEVKDVSRFGVVELKPDGRIAAFHEKPSGKVKSRLINAGIYASTSQIFSYIEPRRTSMELEVFPRLASENRLYGFQHKGEWGDVGKFEDYLKVNFKVAEALAGEKPRIEGSAEYNSTVKLVPPVILGDGVRLGSGSRIGPNAILGRNVKVGENCQISNSVVFDGVEMEDGCLVKGSILGEEVFVGREAKITGGSVVGDLSIIAPKVKISRKVYVCPRKEVNKPALGPKRIV